MKYGRINKTDIANGDGVRVALWVSGCSRHCPGCFNPETWSYEYGEEFTGETFRELVTALDQSYISGLTILGGEPLDPLNVDMVTDIVRTLRFIFRDKTIWIYTGYDYEEVKDLEIMDFIDVLVDGRFIEEEKDISLRFRGSKNQNIINLQEVRRIEKGGI